MATDLRIEADDQPGVLSAIGEALGGVGINIEGCCAVAGDGRGFVHVLVQEGAPARQALEDGGFTVAAEREAIVVESVNDRPGYLGEIARKVTDAGCNIEVAYLATRTRLVVVADDAKRARTAL